MYYCLSDNREVWREGNDNLKPEISTYRVATINDSGLFSGVQIFVKSLSCRLEIIFVVIPSRASSDHNNYGWKFS